MANNFTPVGDESQINLAPNQDSDQFNPDIAALTDGRFFVAFSDSVVNANVVGQFVNGDGTLSGSNVDIEISAGNQIEPAVAFRAGGGAIVVWNDVTDSDEIHYATISGAGIVGAVQTILDGNNLEDARVATLADGRSLVVARQVNASNDIVFRFVDAAGAPTGSQEFIDDAALNQDEAAVAASGNQALVVYKSNAGDGRDIVQARFFDGTSFGAKVTVADTGNDADDPDVVALTDGRFLVVWEDDDTSLMHFRFVSSAGVPLGSVIDVAGLGPDNDFPRAAALPDGGFILTWESSAGVIAPDLDPSGAVFARRFDSAGNPVGDIFLANRGDNDSQGNPAVATNVAGQTVVVWHDGHVHSGIGEDNDPFGIRGRAFVVSVDVVDGTAGDDIIETYGLSEIINGLEGDDLISAFGGNDVVRGNAGFDRILGGLGDDRLFGDAGEDLLNGEAGNDLLSGGLGRDVQIGGSGRDIFDFNAPNESRVGPRHDVIKGFNHAEHDRINLQTIDADTTADGNQAFDFIGRGTFTNTAGELRSAGALLQGDTNGDGIADFEVKVTGLGIAVDGDFVL